MCKQCNKPIGTDNFVEVNGDPVCEICRSISKEKLGEAANVTHSSAHSLPVSHKCTYCSQKIQKGEKVLLALNKVYHDHHFLCDLCAKPLGVNKFIDLRGNPVCVPCYLVYNVPFCEKCKTPIVRGREYWKTKIGSYHTTCFTCNTCGGYVKPSSFYVANNMPCCDKCFIEFVNNNNLNNNINNGDHNSQNQ